jgi:hypothetical protein
MLTGCDMVNIYSDPPRWVNVLPMAKEVSISHGVVEGVSTREVLKKSLTSSQPSSVYKLEVWTSEESPTLRMLSH